LALEGEVGRLYARLSARVPSVFAIERLQGPDVEDPSAAIAELHKKELTSGLVLWPERAQALTRPELALACKRLGLPRGGRHAELVQRLRGHVNCRPGRWLRVRHKPLIRRLERWAFLQRHRNRSTLVVQRLGHVIWPEYRLTDGPGLHANRRALLRWEGLLHTELTTEQALVALQDGSAHAGGRLDLHHRLHRKLCENARALERSEVGEAVTLYKKMDRAGWPADPIRHARSLELNGAPKEALDLLSAHRSRHGPVQALGIGRAGRRLARSLNGSWAPDRPLRKPPKREVRLQSIVGDGPRPIWRVDGRDWTIEAAVVAELTSLGRVALHVENALWTTLFALLFADTYFLPVPNSLPVRWLSGPLDLGSPRFYTARRAAVDQQLSAIKAGAASDLLSHTWQTRYGQRLGGCHWGLTTADHLRRIVQGLGPKPLVEILLRLLKEGWRAARGLPDLVILPGPEIRLRHALPSKLSAGLHLVEVKGPTDSVRDAQAVWFDHLLVAQAPISLWEVTPLLPSARDARSRPR
ncbi:MAG: hypothetical protein GWP91_01700, partial [Rhodobacterales bacterium]|nr:hypothetical protein [Rhodobacterales bacterium]